MTPEIPQTALDKAIARSRGAADLSPAAIAQRQRSEKRGNGTAGLTGRAMATRAREVFDAAQRARRVASKRPAGARRDAAARKATEALMTAATQIRIAELTPLDTGFLHHLSIQQIQAVEQSVRHDIAEHTSLDEGLAILAVDTHTRIEAEKARASRNQQEPS